MSPLSFQSKDLNLKTKQNNHAFVVIFDTEKPLSSALRLACSTRQSLRFVVPVPKAPSLVRSLIFRALHIEPVFTMPKSKLSHPQALPIWKNLREALANNQGLVFFISSKNTDVKLQKFPVKLALHTESVFDFKLQVNLYLLQDTGISDARKRLITLSEINLLEYEQMYKYYPAHTVRRITQSLQQNLDSIKETPYMVSLDAQSKQLVS